jgi:enoyl-CoA hydratase
MIHWSLDAGIRTAVLDRLERRNALDRATVHELAEHLAAAPEPAAPVIITGAGTTFCSGFDLASGEGATFRAGADTLFDAILDYPAPVIAALNGPAVGMGAILALTCDLRVGGSTSWFEIPAARLDVVLDESYLARVSQRVGLPAAQALFVASARVSADRALALGMLHGVADDPMGEARAWATRVLSVSSRSIAAHKAMLNHRSVPTSA